MAFWAVYMDEIQHKALSLYISPLFCLYLRLHHNQLIGIDNSLSRKDNHCSNGLVSEIKELGHNRDRSLKII